MDNTNKTVSQAEYSRRYYLANRERIKARAKAWRAANVERDKATKADYRRRNPEKKSAAWMKWHYEYQCRRKAENPSLRVYSWVLRRMNDALTKHGAGRRVTAQSRIVQLLGCEWVEFMSHIERQFAPGMTWENHGRGGWHFDHIRPMSSFDLTVEEQLKQACHFTNVQPLWAADNVRKGSKIP